MKKVWNNAVLEELEIKATAQIATENEDYDGYVYANDGETIIGIKRGTGSGDFESFQYIKG